MKKKQWIKKADAAVKSVGKAVKGKEAKMEEAVSKMRTKRYGKDS